MRPTTLAALCAAALLWCTHATAATPERQPFTAADVALERWVASPAISADGEWVAYTVTANDLATDEQSSDLWMARWDGSANIRLTHSKESESSPKWSPDGRYLGFLAARDGDGEDESPTQVWLLDRRGGEAQVLTGFEGDVAEFAWSPDGSMLAVIAWDEDVAWRKSPAEGKTAPPIVVDRYYFKEDYTGYTGPERRRLYLVNVATGATRRLTESAHGETRPAWSPDGKRIAFLSPEGDDPDRGSRFGLYTLAVRDGAKPHRIAGLQGENGDSSWMADPAWSPDGRRIAFVAGGDPKLVYYATHRVHVIEAAGGTARPLATALDRNMTEPRFSADGRHLYVLLEDDRNQHLARIALADDSLERVREGRREVLDYDVHRDGRIAVLESDPSHPYEVFALQGSGVRALSRQNDAWLAGKQVAAVEETSFSSKDGTEIHGFLVRPPGSAKARKYPAVLDIHGGPVSQFANAFDAEWQVLASAGYVVIAANPRGSSGRGQDFALGIWADWGNKDGEDVLAAVDHAVREGFVDPKRLGVGGWSYGGILTNQVIARDPRFKAAVSGASSSNALAGYGTDMYTREYESELGTPWDNTDVYLRVSYPFLNAGKIRTPTLFLCGEKDFNVPLLNSEQMYQALRSRGIDTQLVIYPGQYHGLDVPSYLVDRMQRNLDWYAKYL